MTWGLWLVLVATLPLPYFMIETGRVPAAELFLLAAVTSPLVISDPSLTTRFIAGLFVAQSLIYAALLYVFARLGMRLIERRPTRRGRALAWTALAALLVAVSFFHVYRAPLSHGPGTTNLVGVFR